jgi:DNA polymerase III alpha subunit
LAGYEPGEADMIRKAVAKEEAGFDGQTSAAIHRRGDG